RRYVHVYVNGAKRNTVMEDIQQPNNNMGEQWFPEAGGGEVHKVQLWFEFDDAAAGFSANGASLGNFTTSGGVKKVARYRWNLAKRGFDNYLAHDYTNIFRLVDTVNTPATGDTYTRTIESALDVEEWARTLLVEKVVGNWDSYGNGGGQNMYLYKPAGDTWRMMIWDIDFAFQSGNPADALFNITDAPLTRIFNHPPFARLYWRAIKECANGPLARANALIDAKFAALTSNGAGVSSPQGIKDYITARRNYMLGLLPGGPANHFDITSNSGNNFSTANNLVTLTGRASVDVATIEVNGSAYGLTWSTLTNWTLRLALPPGTTVLNVRGYDRSGNTVSGATDTITVTVTAPPALPEDFVVINEVMFAPAAPDAEFVELFNTSTNFSFDLSNWRFNGIDFVFPEGTIMA
ncbi:MAG TPA: CotH kinase family protein, partial [Burkholderiales bacterium]|nr:CotH kinase family protein [Burkholderiales bacterium]